MEEETQTQVVRSKRSLVVFSAVVCSALAVAVGVATLSTTSPAEAAARRRFARQTTTTTAKPKAPTTSSSVKPTTATTVKTTAPSPSTSVKAPVAPGSTSSTVPAPKSTSSSNQVLFGAATEENNSGTLNQLASFEAHAGKKAALYGMYKSFYWDPNFPTAEATTVRTHGSIPMITWEPFNPSNGVNQPEYALSTITAGKYDTMIRNWANQIKAFGSPVWLRFAHEMNSDWYPWAEGVNGNAPGSYVAAYRHVHAVFANAGVTNVKWVWNPNVVMDGIGSSLTSLYPGDAYVDMVGIDGYNWGASTSWGTWQTPASVFGQTMTQVRAITKKGIVIGETSSTEAGGNKATWIKDYFSWMKANTDIKAFIWFNISKETDWRIESSSAAQAAFASALSDPTFIAG